ncbi:DNA-directed DNA polymerase [Spirochaetia bacterium]|nr:DNA-directed DNA polymerase [Spirochaetia bacterium]
MAEFTHLHVHSDNSIQDAAVSVMALADRAEELGMSHLALTDHGNMFGAMEFIAACAETVNAEGKHAARKNPITPIIGCEVYVSPGSRHEKAGSEGDNKYYHLVLLSSNREGYLNLLKLCSCAYTEGFYYRPRIDDEILAQYHGGLIALSACVSGEIPKLIQTGKNAEAEAKALFYRDLFGKDSEGRPNFYLEIQDHGIPVEVLRNSSLSQQQINDELIAMAGRTGIPLAATNDVHYLKREDAAAHDILLCIGTGKKRTEEKRKKYHGDQFYLKSAEEMAALFPHCPEAIANTMAIARRCAADVPRVKVKDLPQYLPEFKIPPDFDDANSYLRFLAAEGLGRRYHNEKEGRQSGETASWEDIQKRAEYELDVIIQMGFTGYFLIVADFINWAKDRGIDVGPGRGSGAGSIVAYALRITDIDPLKYGLLFERFLNPERISMPDFDVDFCNERREEVIAYVTEKYGKERVAQIITFGTLGAKAVIKDVARTLGISIPESNMISELIPRDPKITLGKAFAEEPKLRELEQNPQYTELFTLARKLEGLKRHSSIHAAGVVIGKNDLSGYVPLYRDPKTGGIATQYTMNYLENCGLVKMDFLGLKTLDVLKHTEDLIHRRGLAYADFSITAIPEDDEATFTMLGEGKSFEVFQFESEGMQNVLRQARPGRIEDLIALNALYRPGPMANISQFTESKNGLRKISYPDQSLEEVLKETYGVIVYQEQVMQVARIIAGFTLGHADELRRAMGKKNIEKMVKEKAKFIAGAKERGYSEQKADEIFELLIPFAGYGFNKSHAAAYSVLAYHTAYLKANFPAEFMAANLSNEIHSADKDKLTECISEGRKMGLEIDPPDVNYSDKFFTVVEGRIVFGFLGIKGIGSGPADEIIQKRAEGLYKSFMDFLDRVTLQTNQPHQSIVSRKVIELLIKTGAFDSFGVNRATLLVNMEAAIEHAQTKKDETKFGQVSLFEDTGESSFPDFEFTQMPEMDRAEQLTIEKELIGFYFSGHPLDTCKEVWKQYVRLDISDLDHAAPGNYTLVGVLKSLKVVTDKTGKPMAFGTLEDYRGEADLAFFGDVWAAARDKIHQDEIIAVRGRLDTRRGKTSIQVSAVLSSLELKEEGRLAELGSVSQPLDQYREAWEQAVTLDLSEEGLARLAAKADSQNRRGQNRDGQIRDGQNRDHVLIGYITSLRRHTTKDQKEMAFASLEDFRGRIDLVFFARCWELNRDKIAEKTCAALRGKLDFSRERPGFQVSSVLDLGKLRRNAAKTAAERTSGEAPGETPDTAQKTPPEIPAAAGTIAASAAAGFGMDAAGFRMDAAADTGQILREVHIRLRRSAAENERNLYPLRDYLIDHPGQAQVFIHLETNTTGTKTETVIRTAVQLSMTADKEEIAVLGNNPAVAEVWVA